MGVGVGVGVGAAGGASWVTVTVACMKGWISQKYRKVPVWPKVKLNDWPVETVPLSHSPVSSPGSPAVVVWPNTSRLVQLTVVPTCTVSSSSLKFLMSEPTSTSTGCGVGVGAAVGVGVGNGVGVDVGVGNGAGVDVCVGNGAGVAVGVGRGVGVDVGIGGGVGVGNSGVEVGASVGVGVSVSAAVGADSGWAQAVSSPMPTSTMVSQRNRMGGILAAATMWTSCSLSEEAMAGRNPRRTLTSFS